METITIVGAGVAGMTAAISLAEAGAPVVLFDARSAPGGRARSLDGPYRANLGPHVLYKDGAMFRWLAERALLPPIAGVPLTGLRLRWGGELHRTPPLGLIPAILKLRGRRAPADESFRAWAARHTDERTAALLSSAAGVFAFHHDPGALSAAFVWERTVRTLLTPPPAARYPRGGWQALVDMLDARVAQLGVRAPLRRARDGARGDHDRRHRAGRRGAAAGRALRRRQRPHAVRRPRRAPAPRRPVRRLRPRRVRLGRALHRARSVARARRGRS